MGTIIDNIVFEWDEEKNRINFRKHNVDFFDAANKNERRKYYAGEASY